MKRYLSEISNLENNRRTALTKKYPVLRPLVLESKRLINTIQYTINPTFKIKKSATPRWFNLTEHSSPLYRKFNKKELDEGKIENIKIAIKSIDGIIIMPGKTFSLWKQIGRPSIKKGYKKGLVLSGGALKEDIGGGLCQLSNLIAYMFACTECDFKERKHHSKDVFPDTGRTVPFASGATVFFYLIDLKVKNTYSFPIKINLRLTDTQLRGSISSPVSLNYTVKVIEQHPYFIKSVQSGKIYRCNEVNRVFYSKIAKQEIKRIVLWKNIAEVMYDEKEIKQPIVLFDATHRD